MKYLEQPQRDYSVSSAKKNGGDRPGESEKRERMRAMFGRNRELIGDYDVSLSAKCRNGVFVGKNSGGVLSFKGMPYAKPPVGENRWRRAKAPDDSDRVFEAYYFGKSPIQTEWPSEEGSYYPQSENCLTLNVWTAEKGRETADRTVMVFFHGGSYGWGATSDPIYDGHNLVAENPDIVLVTAEYRVGIMGFIDFSQVKGGESFSESGNLGLLDHVAALEWVRDNIAAFGGDKNRVAIFGESAGGGTVTLLPLIPEAKGLFRRVIAESGSLSLTYSRKECLGLAERLLKETGAENMDELMVLSEAELMEVNEKLNDFNNFPERDGVVLPEDLYGAYASGATADVDLMFGSNADEIRYWIREMGYYSEEWLGPTIFRLGVPVMFDSNMERVSAEDRKHVDKYMTLLKKRKLWKIVEFYNDILFRVPAAAAAAAHAKNGGKAYMYYWKYPSAYRGIGACHAVELAYVFNNLDVTIYTGKNICVPLAKEVQKMWVNFAKTGDPSTQENKWAPYDEKERVTAILDKKITFESDPLGKRREEVQPLLGYYFNGCYSNLSLKIPPIYWIAAILAAVPAALLIGARFAFEKIRKALNTKII